MNERREARNTALIKGIEMLVDVESAYAEAEHGECYHSPAEGYMVVREESLEVADNLSGIGLKLDEIDQGIRLKERTKPIKGYATDIKNLAIATAIEAIHLTAAAEKLERSYDMAPNRYFEEPEDDE